MTSCSSTWTLLLLLPLFIGFARTSSASSHIKMGEFNKNLEKLGKMVKDCENCSSVNISDNLCQCLNFSVPQKECPFPDSFISGLTFLESKISKNKVTVSHLIKKLKWIDRDHEVKQRFCNLTMKYDFNFSNVSSVVTISPKTFHKYLEDLAQQYNAQDPPAQN